MQSVHLFTGFVLIRKFFRTLAVFVLQDEKQRISGLGSSEHGLHVIYCIWNVGNIFHSSRFLELCMSLAGLTACCHYCVLVVRLFGLLDQKPGSVNTSRNNKVEMQ